MSHREEENDMISRIALTTFLLMGAASAANAVVAVPAPVDANSVVIQVRDGCGGGWYRGPGGACHRIGYGPGYGYYGPGWGPHGPPYRGPGQRCWQGRWGHWHCR
jgi:hypothetical protein